MRNMDPLIGDLPPLEAIVAELPCLSFAAVAAVGCLQPAVCCLVLLAMLAFWFF